IALTPLVVAAKDVLQPLSGLVIGGTVAAMQDHVVPQGLPAFLPLGCLGACVVALIYEVRHCGPSLITPLVVAVEYAVQSVGHHAICDGRTVPASNLHHVRSQCLVPGLPLVDDADVHAAVDVLTGGAGETRLQPVSVVNHDL